MTDLNDRGLVQREGEGLEGSIRVRGSIAWRFRQGNEDKKDALSAIEYIYAYWSGTCLATTVGKGMVGTKMHILLGEGKLKCRRSTHGLVQLCILNLPIGYTDAMHYLVENHLRALNEEGQTLTDGMGPAPPHR
jgi:hypothetical protein